jgi:Cys-tRNA(Pro)/Cys-tRNA(Cys) deacylase
MTPAVNFLKKNKIPFTLHKYDHDPQHASFGMEAAEKLGIDPSRVFKTLVVEMDEGGLAVAIVRVDQQLNLKSLARALGVKKTALADARSVQTTTGYVLGGVSPLAQKKWLPTVVDEAALDQQTILVSGGRRGLDIEVRPQDLIGVLAAQSAPISA